MRKVTQEELVKRDTPPGALRNNSVEKLEAEVPVLRASVRCGGLLGQDVPRFRRRSDCAAPACSCWRRRDVVASAHGASPGVGADLRLRRDCAAPACGRKGPGICSQVDSEFDSFAFLLSAGRVSN